MIDSLLAAGLLLGLVLALRVEGARLARLRAGHAHALEDLAVALSRRGSALAALTRRLPGALPAAHALLEALGRVQRAALDALGRLERDPADGPAARALFDAGESWARALAGLEAEGQGDARALLEPLRAASRRSESRLLAARAAAGHHARRRAAHRLRRTGSGRLALAEVGR